MKELWTDRRKRNLIIVSSLAFLVVAHSYRWMNTMHTHDSLLIVQKDYVWQISLGRIFNPLYVWLRGRLLAPMNIAFFASIFLIVSAALVINLLRLEKTISIILCCGFMITFETVASINGVFLLSLDLDMLALLLSVAAACFFTGRESPLRYLAGIISITLMLGLFQSFVEVTIMLICLVLLRDVLEGGDPKKIFLKGLRCIGLLILGGLSYYLIFKATLKFTGIAPANTFNGLVKMKTLTIPYVISLSGEAWKFTLRYLFSDSLIAHRTISAWIYRGLGLITLFGIFWIFRKKQLKTGAAALVIFILAIMPLGGNCVYVLSIGLKHLLMTYSFVFFSILVVMIFDMIQTGSRFGFYYLRIIPALCAVLLLNHVIYSNQWYLQNDLFSRAGMSFMTRLVSDMEDVDGYETGQTPIMILGSIYESPASYRDPGFESRVGLENRLAVTYYETYSNYFRFVLGYPANLVPINEVIGYLDDPQIQAMPIYPAKGSIQMINGTLVVRLSEDLRPDDFKWDTRLTKE